MRATVAGEGHIPATGNRRAPKRGRFSVFTVLGKARKKLSARVSPTSEHSKARQKTSVQMQKMSESIDEVEDMETEMSPERMCVVNWPGGTFFCGLSV